MRVEQFARGRQEGLAVDGEPHHARRSLQQGAAQVRLEALDLEADGRLRGVERVGGARETGQLGDQHEGADGIEIEWFHFE